MMASSSSSKSPEFPKPAKEAKMETSAEPNWLELPRDVTANIIHRLGAIEILLNAQRVCPLWRNICKDPLMWRTIDMTVLATSYKVSHSLEKMCRHAIDRSCGHLEDISIFGLTASDDLLKYIAHSTSHLRRIQLSDCWAITNKGLIEVAKKIPLLEELDISSLHLSKVCLEAIGECCPLLKGLKLNKKPNKGIECDDDAFAIAKTMPELCYLQLGGNKLTNAGVLAILDGCPHLEFLDLQTCFHVNLKGSLGKRCAEQIKDLRFPDYSLAATSDDDDSANNDHYADLYCDCGLTSESDDEETKAYVIADYYGLL